MRLDRAAVSSGLSHSLPVPLQGRQRPTVRSPVDAGFGNGRFGDRCVQGETQQAADAVRECKLTNHTGDPFGGTAAVFAGGFGLFYCLTKDPGVLLGGIVVVFVLLFLRSLVEGPRA